MKQPAHQVTVTRRSSLRDALALLDSTGAGILLLLDDEGHFERTLTDGDLRRLLLRGGDLGNTLHDIPKSSSWVVKPGTSRRDALDIMNRHGIHHLPVVADNGHVVEVLSRQEIDEHILLSTPHMGHAERDFVEEAFRTNWIAPLGPNVDAFEREMAGLLGMGHAAAVSSGTAAIHLGLRLLNVGAGDRVFCSTLTFAGSSNPIVYQGAEPVFIDSDRQSWNMCPLALDRAFETARREGWMPKAVIIVNLYGQSADMDALLPICAHHGVPVLEDAAESLGASYKGRPSGTFGTVSALSFNGNKIITTSGGGMLVSDDEQLILKARFLSTQARDAAPHYEHSEIGFNYRMSNILAGVGRGQLKVLGERVEARRAVFRAYHEALGDDGPIEWMPEPAWSRSTRWLTACTLKPDKGLSARDVIRRLGSELIEARPVWKPMHLQPVYAGCRLFTSTDQPVANELFERGLCLPSGSNMSPGQLARTVDVLRVAIRP